jgi:hypothetical protein
LCLAVPAFAQEAPIAAPVVTAPMVAAPVPLPPNFAANFAAALSRFNVSSQNLVSAMNDVDGKTLEIAGNGRAKVVLSYHAQPMPLRDTAQQVAIQGTSFSDLMPQLADAKGNLDSAMLNPAVKTTRGLRSALANWIVELRKLQPGKLALSQARAVNQVTNDTVSLTITLETLTPLLAELSKNVKSTAKPAAP